MRRVILLDRDGVINQDSFDYIKSADEFILIPESLDAIARLTKVGYLIGVATNQSGVARGLYSEDELLRIHQKMLESVRQAGGDIHAIEYCIHHPDEHCFCRKPQPGMLHALAKKLNSSLKDVPFVGDRVSDIQAARAVGANPVMVLSSMTDKMALSAYPEVPVYASLGSYVDQLLKDYE